MADYEEQVLITGVKSGKHCCTQSRVRVSREPTWDLVKIDEVGTSLNSLGFYRKSIYIFARILNLIADSNYFTINKSY